MEKKDREEVRDLLNKAVNIEDAQEGYTMEVSLKSFQALTELIRVLQQDYTIGIGGSDKVETELFNYELSEDVKVSEDE